MKHTDEQIAIINYLFTLHKILKIQAFAGTGKSTTVMEYIKNNPDKNVLYLVYNKSMKDEALKMFRGQPNVTVLTIHGLAYRYTARQFMKPNGTSTIVNTYTKLELLEDLGYDRNDVKSLSYYEELYNLYIMFLNSGYKDVSDFVNSQRLPHLKSYTINMITNDIRKICNMKYQKQANCEHDFYLKIFHKTSPELKDYDVVIVDESQDISGVLLDILKNVDINVIVVGDKYQNIYSWRHTVSAIEELNGMVLPLSYSFRIGQTNADICNLLINEVTGDGVNIKGVNENQTVVRRFDMDEQYARLFRYNAGLMDTALYEAKSGNKIYFVGGLKSYPFTDLLSLSSFCANSEKYKKRTWELARTQPRMISGFAKFLCRFDNFKDFMKYAHNHNDIRLKSYGNTIIKAFKDGRNLFEEYNLLKEHTTTSMDKADIILSTVHKSKGVTLGNTIVEDDVLNMVELQAAKDKGDYFDESTMEMVYFNKFDYYEELYVLYVAITRCSKKLVLPSSLVKWLIEHKKVDIFNEGIVEESND